MPCMWKVRRLPKGRSTAVDRALHACSPACRWPLIYVHSLPLDRLTYPPSAPNHTYPNLRAHRHVGEGLYCICAAAGMPLLVMRNALSASVTPGHSPYHSIGEMSTGLMPHAIRHVGRVALNCCSAGQTRCGCAIQESSACGVNCESWRMSMGDYGAGVDE